MARPTKTTLEIVPPANAQKVPEKTPVKTAKFQVAKAAALAKDLADVVVAELDNASILFDGKTRLDAALAELKTSRDNDLRRAENEYESSRRRIEARHAIESQALVVEFARWSAAFNDAE